MQDLSSAPQHVRDRVAALAKKYDLKPKNGDLIKEPSGALCPDCGSILWMQSGCETCMACGYSRCG